MLDEISFHNLSEYDFLKKKRELFYDVIKQRYKVTKLEFCSLLRGYTAFKLL